MNPGRFASIAIQPGVFSVQFPFHFGSFPNVDEVFPSDCKSLVFSQSDKTINDGSSGSGLGQCLLSFKLFDGVSYI